MASEPLIAAESSVIRAVRRPCSIQVEGVGSASTHTRGRAVLRLASCDGNFGIDVDFFILDTVTSPTPSSNIASSCWQHLRSLTLADPSFGKTGRIDALIGADIWGAIIQDGIVRASINEPFAQSTNLGWVVFGPATIDHTTPPSVRSLQTHLDITIGDLDQRLDELVRLFCELDDQSISSIEENDICEQIFMATHRRAVDGRYIVQIPFRPDASVLGNSHRLALRQFHQLERRLSANPSLHTKYCAFMREYIDLGHMELASDGDSGKGYFIPHHAVTEKFRVVFNASAKSSNGISLNETQLSGPTIQELLINIILRFRRFAVALSADIEKMFRQVSVDERHRCWQKILWRDSPTEQIRTYKLTTVTYGMASGPFNAIRSMQQCAKDNCGIFPDQNRATAALQSILRDFYVDDYLTSVETSQKAAELAGDISLVLQKGCFNLCKWQSNDPSTLASITNTSNTSTTIELKSPEITVLGLHWNPMTDELFYRIDLDNSPTQTKRQILSETARLYDPTNMCAPVIIVAKVFIQTIWQHGLDWDSQLPESLLTLWLDFRASLPRLQDLRIPRCLGIRTGMTSHIHGFCDASQKAFAAVIYLCSCDDVGEFISRLVTAKTRVAPSKLDINGHRVATIPRLELCAARLLAELLSKVRHAMDLMNAPYTLWSDSSIVLAWLRKSSSSYKPYVANRVAYIQQHTDVARWQHVRTHLNPADCASRGISANALIDHQLWWYGPTELMKLNTIVEIPPPSEEEIEAMDFEAKPIKAHISQKTTQFSIQTQYRRDNEILIIDLVERFSKIGQLLRTTAYVLRGNQTRRQYWHRTFVDTDEISMALKLHIRLEQEKYFGIDINFFKSNRYVPVASKLASLDPYLDPDCILRVGGRLRHALIPHEQRNPIILPKESILSLLVVRDIHLRDAHADVTLMLQTLRKQYWIISGRALVKRCVHECVVCRRHSQHMARQQMASLPPSRVVASPPFSSSGVDYCGPFSIRIGSQRTRTTKKTYVAIFVCMTTKAVHIELAEDLSARSFLNVFSRFTSRRGPCSHLYSDNGTQFKRANTILQNDLAEWHSNYVQQQMANHFTKWHFISAAAPHQGGLWEAAVKSAKKHLVRVVGNQILYYDQFHTLLVRIEACMNSRPLIALHDDVDDRLALSPADFLVGRSLMALPEPETLDLPTNRLHYWNLLRQMHQSFWKNWHDDYLVSLQHRSKWRRSSENLQINDVVVLRHENLPPTQWRLARIVEVHPGSDGLVRSVTVEYALGGDQNKSTLKRTTRPVQKVCRLLSCSDPEPTGPAGQ